MPKQAATHRKKRKRMFYGIQKQELPRTESRPENNQVRWDKAYQLPYLLLNCEACEFQSTLETSKKVEGTGSGRASNEVNLRMVSFARSIGRGYSVLENFSACLNSPQPMPKKITRKPFPKY
eukprot:gene14958-6112_t